MNPLKITLFSRLNPPNIGHGLMHEGMAKIVRDTFKDRPIEFVHIEQHYPFRHLYYAWNPLRYLDRWPGSWFVRKFNNRPLFKNLCGDIGLADLPRWLSAKEGVSRLFWTGLKGSLSDADLAIAVGGPSLISGMSRSGQIVCMMHFLHGAFKNVGVPVLNLSVGSCFPYKNPPSELWDPLDRDCALKYLKYSTVSTVRDKVAVQLYKALGEDIPLIPCPALASYPGDPSHKKPEYIAINYMESWPLSEPHQACRIDTDISTWKRSIKYIIDKFGKQYKFIFVCHNQKEVELARKLEPNIFRIEPQTPADYITIAANTVAAVACRIHTAIPLASAGIPSITVGSDTRMGTVEAMGLPVAYVEDVTPEWLAHTLQELISTRAEKRERLLEMKKATIRSYADLIREAVAA